MRQQKKLGISISHVVNIILTITSLGLLSIILAYCFGKPDASYLLLTATIVAIIGISVIGVAIINSMSYHWTRIINLEEKEII